MWETCRVSSWVRFARSGAGALGFASLAACSNAASYEEAPLGSAEQPIVGGSETPLDKAEFTGALFQDFGGEFFQMCGGTFIAEDVVVTAAHCTVGFGFPPDEQNQLLVEPADPSLLRVVRRPASLAAVEEFLEVESVYVHPDFDWVTLDNDIAIWKLAQPSPGPVLAIASKKATAFLASAGSKGSAFGYGVTDPETGESSDTLQGVRLPVVDHAECQAGYYEAFGGASQPLLPEEIVTDNMLCAGRAGKDTCQGDSGGPLTFMSGGKDQLVGITSWGIGCALPGFPGVYTQASNFRPWVADCVSGVCDTLSEPISVCNWGFTDCDGDPTNGCEANTLGASHCGGCGMACDADEACVYDWDLGEPSAYCAPAEPLKPRLRCVFDPGDGSGRIASFGYNNQNEDTVFVRRGPKNRFTGVPDADETMFGFPGMEEFRAGNYVNAPLVYIGSDPVRWKLVGPDGVMRNVRVDADAKACTTNPFEEGFELPRTRAERNFRLWNKLWQRPR